MKNQPFRKDLSLKGIGSVQSRRPFIRSVDDDVDISSPSGKIRPDVFRSFVNALAALHDDEKIQVRMAGGRPLCGRSKEKDGISLRTRSPILVGQNP